MATKLLEWGGALFLLRLELEQLQIQRVDVEFEEKKVSLTRCTVRCDAETAALLVDARLVAAQEVEDTTLATRYPVLVFEVVDDVNETPTAPGSRVSRKRRRPTETEESTAAEREPVSTQSRAPGMRLLFCLLYEAETDDEMGLRFLNELELTTLAGGNGGGVAGAASVDSLQVFLADGPYVLLFGHGSRKATVLKMQRATPGGGAVGFCVCREQVDIASGVGGDSTVPTKVVSCAYISEAYCTKPHLLIHLQWTSQPSSTNSDMHAWCTLDVEDEQKHLCDEGRPTKCRYLPVSGACGGPLSKLEQITCCCLISELNEWDFTASSSSVATSFTSWDTGSRFTDTGVSTLMITGTSCNTIYAHTSGVLLASYVLPAQPAEMWCMCEEDSTENCHVLCVRCNDVNRSFFMLEFSSNPDNTTFELLLSFNHVGHAFVGNFISGHACNVSSLVQVLLLNSVPGITGNVRENVEVNECFGDGQLVKRSVLVTQKIATPNVKLSCHRLRLREGKKVKHASRSKKRSRNDDKGGPKDDSVGSKPQPFRYIERTQKASSRDRNAIRPDESTDGVEGVLTASNTQLAKLACSLSTRLSNGFHELERLQMTVNGKRSLSRQLDQLIIQEWRQYQQTAHPSKEHSRLTKLLATRDIESRMLECQNAVDMETIVAASTESVVISKPGDGDADSSGNLALEYQVSLEYFRVLNYMPSSSLFRAEVILNNLSDTMVADSFVVLTAPQGGRASFTQGWVCSSSVVPEFPPAVTMVGSTAIQPGKARFLLELQFAPSFTFLRTRKPLLATVWLQWGASCGDPGFICNGSVRQPSLFAVAVASVSVSSEELLCATSTTNHVGWNSSLQQEQEQLLFVSNGSSLTSWLRNQSRGVFNSAAAIVRPKFAVVNLEMTARELMLYELSQMVANLPSDVYAMHNPFQRQHLSALQRVLDAMRQEIIGDQQHGSLREKEKKISENKTQVHHKIPTLKTEKRDPASIRRKMQQNTDLQVTQLLLVLQKRVNFHTMWFDSAAKDCGSLAQTL